MVDFRPLLFLNALALMLLVTAGFASIRQDMPSPELAEASTEQVIADASESEPAETPASTARPEQDTPAVAQPTEATEEPATPVAEVDIPAPEAEAEPALEPFTVDPMPEDPEMLAMAEPVSAMDAEPQPAAKPQPEPEPEPTTGKLTLRSHVVGDSVTIKGRSYGATRRDIALQPGSHHLTTSKDGYTSWSDRVLIQAARPLTLVG